VSVGEGNDQQSSPCRGQCVRERLELHFAIPRALRCAFHNMIGRSESAAHARLFASVSRDSKYIKHIVCMCAYLSCTSACVCVSEKIHVNVLIFSAVDSHLHRNLPTHKLTHENPCQHTLHTHTPTHTRTHTHVASRLVR